MAHRILAIGLPKTGKTTFIIALWHTLDTRAVPGSLVLDRVEGNVEYLEKLRERWMRREPLGRTRSGPEQTVEMLIRHPESGTTVLLEIPDLAGETYSEQWLDRGWTEAFDEIASGCDALLVFLHPNAHTEPTLIEEVFVPEVMQVIEEGADDAGQHQPDEDSDHAATDWDPEQAPSTVQLVEVLQFLEREVLPEDQPVRTAVIVSAWDTVCKGQPGLTPEQWVRRRAPLFDQYLRANPTSFLMRPYGVSAQGGDLAVDREVLLDADEPTDPLLVVDEAETSNDLTRPIRWLMGLEEARQ
jgi:GTPase SAR1 family protein